ncbi:hypothetical protein V5E97_25655 [Singulisphaera sp. Ch08]|uniref:Lipoprotein n=1 Tax=Singulisphaera sp. Ch08 TaxID=3120278 RepID=A0AAU7C9P2_9BACT
MRFTLALMIFAGFAVPAVACINDSELPNHEREFRSNYGEPTSPASPTPPPPPPRTVDLLEFAGHPMLLGTGAALLTGAVLVTMTDRRART